MYCTQSLPKKIDCWQKNPAYGRQSISQPMQIIAPIPKKPACKARFTKKKLTFLAWQFYTLCEQKFLNLRPILFITFPQGFKKYKKNVGHWTLGKGGKKTNKQSEKYQYQKNPAQWGKIRPKTNRKKWTDGQTHTWTVKLTYRKHLPTGPMLRKGF